jgi:hypothetical protein
MVAGGGLGRFGGDARGARRARGHGLFVRQRRAGEELLVADA